MYLWPCCADMDSLDMLPEPNAGVDTDYFQEPLTFYYHDVPPPQARQRALSTSKNCFWGLHTWRSARRAELAK